MESAKNVPYLRARSARIGVPARNSWMARVFLAQGSQTTLSTPAQVCRTIATTAHGSAMPNFISKLWAMSQNVLLVSSRARVPSVSILQSAKGGKTMRVNPVPP